MEVFVGVEFGVERALVISEIEIAGRAGVALLQSSDRLVDLGGVDEPSVGDALRELVDIGAQALFVLGANGAIFGDALFATAEHVGLRIVGAGFNLDRRLLLSGIER